MRILADEDVPKPVIELIRQDYETESVDENMKGSTDKEVLEYAKSNNLILLTFDTDFVRKTSHKGILLVTSRDQYSKVAKAVKQTLETANTQDLKNEVFMISP